MSGRHHGRVALSLALLLCDLGAAGAGTLTYTPTNPTFGGSPLNGTFLLNQAQSQNQFTPSAQSPGGLGAGTLSPGQLFAQQLQSQLLGSFANQITQAIFGPNAQNQRFVQLRLHDREFRSARE